LSVIVNNHIIGL